MFEEVYCLSSGYHNFRNVQKEKVENNKTVDNEIFLNKGKTGIRLVIKENFIN